MPDEIYMELLNEGIQVWRPVPGRCIAKNVYEILDNGTYDPDDETWMFSPGTWVNCQPRELSGGQALVAFARAQPALTVCLYATCGSDAEAQELAETFLKRLIICAPVRLLSFEPYWRIPAYYGFLFEFTPTGTYKTAFDCLVSLSPQAWSFSGSPPARNAVWNPLDGSVLLTEQVRWGHIELSYTAVDQAEPYIAAPCQSIEEAI